MEELFTNQNYYHNIRIYPLVQTHPQELQKFDVFCLTLETKTWKGVGNWKMDEDNFWRCTYETEQEYDLYMDLERWKDRIEPFHVNDLWNEIKKRYNPFEYVYSPTPNYNMCVSRYHPISRSFFKLWEIMHDFQIVKNNQANEWTVANLAEGPGGFLDCILNYRKNPNDKLYGITLPPENEEIPSWSKIENKRKNQKNRLVYNVHYGNIYNLSTVQRYRRNFGSSKADFVTADGGFDYSSDFNHQEQLSYRMILSEFIVAISIQKVGGDFVLKVFDILTPFTQKILYILTLYYNQVSIIKPYTTVIIT
jgi:23S rRNA U2552 (ribose-2'-O)-methylase RlmE/FtsJ